MRWIRKPAKKIIVGAIAGALCNGRYVIQVPKYGLYVRSRLVWKYVTGTEPGPALDHLDGNVTNDAISNLADAGHGWNSCNRPTRAKSGYMGVSRRWDDKKWVAYIQINKKNKYLGAFDDPKEAHEVYLSALAEGYGNFIKTSNTNWTKPLRLNALSDFGNQEGSPQGQYEATSDASP